MPVQHPSTPPPSMHKFCYMHLHTRKKYPSCSRNASSIDYRQSPLRSRQPFLLVRPAMNLTAVPMLKKDAVIWSLIKRGISSHEMREMVPDAFLSPSIMVMGTWIARTWLTGYVCMHASSWFFVRSRSPFCPGCIRHQSGDPTRLAAETGGSLRLIRLL